MSDDEGPLGDRERAVLDFERDWAMYVGRKDVAIRERFGISSARYYQLLNRAISRAEAVAYDPFTVKRLRRRRERRPRRRAGGALGERPGQ